LALRLLGVLPARRSGLVLYNVVVLALLAWLSLAALGLAYSLLWLYEGVLGVGEGLVVSARGFSPMTALISRSEVESRLAGIEGLSVEYYLIAPVLHGDKLLFLRNTEEDLSGECILVGVDLARDLRIEPGTSMLFSSFFTGEVYELRVCGYTSGYLLVARYETVARIRGVTPGTYSYIVVKGSEESLEKALRALGAEPGRQRLAGFLVAMLNRVGNETRARVYRALTEAYIGGLGLQRDYIVYFAVGVALASVLGSVMIGLDTARRLSETLRVYRLLGASRRSLLAASAFFGLAMASTGFSLSLLLIGHFDLFRFRLLDYVLEPRLEAGPTVVVFAGLASLYTAGLEVGVRGEVD